MNITQIIAIIVIIAIAVIYIAWQICKNGLRKTAIDLIVRAEDTLMNNEEKFDTVVSGIILKLPFPFNVLITTNVVESFVQRVFDEVKSALDYKKGE